MVVDLSNFLKRSPKRFFNKQETTVAARYFNNPLEFASAESNGDRLRPCHFRDLPVEGPPMAFNPPPPVLAFKIHSLQQARVNSYPAYKMSAQVS